MAGPLQGITIIELGSIGPGPFCCMMLADHGARVIRVERPGTAVDPNDVLLRSREVVFLDLKNAEDQEALLKLVAISDALIEGMRPGTLERLGIGPDRLLAANPCLVIGRMTGWGQEGDYAPWAGHDINYIALTGALHAIGPAAQPVPPLALVGDFGGGGMMLAFSVTAAIMHVRSGGDGQVIDCAMTDGASLLMAPFYSYLAAGWWKDKRQSNMIDGGTHFYGVYETADAKFVSVGAIEPQFYQLFLEKLGVAGDPAFVNQMDEGVWPALREKVATIFRSRTREQWCKILEHTDVCFAPVMSLTEAPDHVHNVSRGTFMNAFGVTQPRPGPRYSGTQLDEPRPAREVSLDTLLASLGSV